MIHTRFEFAFGIFGSGLGVVEDGKGIDQGLTYGIVSAFAW